MCAQACGDCQVCVGANGVARRCVECRGTLLPGDGFFCGDCQADRLTDRDLFCLDCRNTWSVSYDDDDNVINDSDRECADCGSTAVAKHADVIRKALRASEAA